MIFFFLLEECVKISILEIQNFFCLHFSLETMQGSYELEGKH